MSTDSVLLKTKIALPVAREYCIDRPDLLDRVASGMSRRLTVISAAAGSGKTTLLIQWLRSSRPRFAWLSLDDKDNDLRRFWRYILFALNESLLPGLSERLSPLLLASPETSVDSFLDALINELYDYGQPLALVLDDYHVIEAAPIHESLTYLLNYLPDHVHVYMASRTELPLPAMPRWLAQDSLTVINGDQLSFNEAEAGELYRRTVGRRIDRKLVQTLVAKTEGWAAGLQMAGISLRESGDDSRFLLDFTGQHRNISDYLFHVAVGRLPEELQQFLKETSVLQRMNPRLCSLLTGRRDAREVLETLKRLNLFVIPLDPVEEWYRYHHLFAEYLQSSVRKQSPQRWLQLHRAAGDSYESLDLLEEAIEHAFVGEDYDSAVQRLSRHILAVLGRGEFPTLLRWFRAFPASFVLPPRLSLLHAFALIVTGELHEAELLLERIQRDVAGAGETAARETTSGLFFLKMNLFFTSGNYAEWFPLADMIQDDLPMDPVFFHINYNTSKPFVRDTRFGMKGRIAPGTEEVGSRIMSILERHGWQHSLFSLYITQAMAEGCYEMNQLDVCRNLLYKVEQGLKLAMAPGLLIPARLQRMRLELTEGRNAQARHTVREMMTAMEHHAEPHWMSILLTCEASVDLADGRLEQAAQTLSAGSPALGYRPSLDKLLAWTMRVRVLYGLADDAAATLLAEQLLAMAEQDEAVHYIVYLSVMLALAAHRQRSAAEACKHLRRALLLGEANRYVRSFIDEGAPMAALLRDYIRQAESRTAASLPCLDYAKKLLDMLVPHRESEAAAEKPHSPDPLTPKEEEIIGLLRLGESNRDIADKLGLTLGTVKVYLNRIYDKLGVRSRVQAVLRVQQLAREMAPQEQSRDR